MEIREATRADYPDIGLLIMEWAPEAGNGYIHRKKPVSDREFVAEEAGVILGWVSGMHTSSAWAMVAECENQPEGWKCSFIVRMFVAQSSRDSGVGERLLEAFIADARKWNNNLVLLHMDETGDAERLRRFYVERKFCFMDPSQEYAGRDPWILGRVLGRSNMN
ncbi:GNAT family N-acetyltransferase [Arthrobacter sp. LAPM80]|uniref:GNAT family N-acetyltransferase n=1 Tax=Arthrobacter sp. LAPM80 TaxID=3141788 RepID=UPI00398BB26B